MKIYNMIYILAFLVMTLPSYSQSNQCLYNSIGGQRSISYDQFYVEVFQSYMRSKNENNQFLRTVLAESAKSLIGSCPEFYSRVNNNELPFQNISSGNEIADRLLQELMNRNEEYRNIINQIKSEQNNFKSWLRRL